MTQDLNANITQIEEYCLNLPSKVTNNGFGNLFASIIYQSSFIINI